MNSDSKFSLSKWYLDCITDSGDAMVGYAASLHWRALALEYSSVLVLRSTDIIRTKTTLHGGSHPTEAVDCVQWNCPPLAVSGIWQTLERPIARTIFSSSTTPLQWACVQPRSWAEIDCGDLGMFSGYGYVDHIEMTAKPWQLPLEELRWGRFLSASDSIIWMDFKGPFPESIVFHNGTLCRRVQVSDTEIVLFDEDFRLTFEETQVLRDGALVSTVLSEIPGVKNFLPTRMLHTHESKWRSRGILKRGNIKKSDGWAIHEVVRWPGE